MSKPSKFSAIIDQARGRAPEPDEAPVEQPPAPPVPVTGTSPAPSSPIPPAPASTPPALPSRPPGRPKGKRSDPAFEQVTAYVPTDLYVRARIALMEDGRRQDFSGLVAELLSGWLAGRVAE